MKNRSFRSIFVSVIIGIILVISIANFVVYGLNYIEIRDSKIQKMEDVDAYMNDMITISLNNLKGLKQICYTDNNARNILLEDNGINDQKTKFENQSYMDNALKHIASMDTVILRATIINRYGNIYCTDTSVPEKYASSIQEMTGEWNLLRGKEDEYYFGGIQGNEENILTFLHPLYTYAKTPIALLAVDLDYKKLQTIFDNSTYEDSGNCFILEGEQELFCTGNQGNYKEEEKEKILQHGRKMLSEDSGVEAFDTGDKKVYISVKQNMLSGWIIVQVIPENEMFLEINQKMKFNFLFLLGALSLVVYFSLYYTKKIIEPLEEFCRRISHTKEGELQIIDLDQKKLTKEIKDVTENYNKMAKWMNEYLAREIVYEKNQRKIQSNMLRYQINPHFLYNTLNIIASMGELSDYPEIVEMTKNLSCIMQYNVKGGRFVTLKAEVDMVKAYLEIQKVRFHGGFSVSYEIEEGVENIRIVKFILQPIVENIFAHGFLQEEEENKILIKAYRDGGRLIILVKDNGEGMSQDKIEELNRILWIETKRMKSIDEEEKSIGINNVNIRLKNCYGEDYGVRIGNNPGKGTEVELLLGIKGPEEETQKYEKGISG